MNEKIQIIQYNTLEPNYEHENIKNSTFKTPISFDNYDINIIDLSSENIWETESLHFDNTRYSQDFNNLKSMLFDSNNSKIIILYPQNITFIRLPYSNIGKKLQYLTSKVQKIINQIYPHSSIIGFEKNFKIIDNNKFSADFYFKTGEKSIINSDKSNKPLTIVQDEKIISTTLEIPDTEYLFDFLNEINLINIKTEAPKWFEEIKCYDDEEQLIIIDKENKKIKNSENKIKESEEILEKNNHFKSILYTNSDELVEIVFEILEEILNCDLSEFNDEKKEDFLIRVNNNQVLIGEIKGVTSNVRFEHVGQVEQHYRRYMDDNPEYVNETIKQVLIINYERKKKPSERTEIHENQIKHAIRNECLIIDTPTLLKIHNLYLNNRINTDKLLD